MKRILLVILALTLCLSALPAFADSNVNINVDAGDHSPVNVNVNSIDGCNNDAVINDGTAGGIIVPVKPGKTPTCIVINGVPGCIEPSDYCGRKREPAQNQCLKNSARKVWAYLEGQLRSIGWWHKTYKFVWSFGTRVIYGSNGDNNHYEDRRRVVFYCTSKKSQIQEKAFLNAYQNGDKFMFVFTTDFVPQDCQDSGYTYDDDLLITGIYDNGYDAVDEFIAYLKSLSEPTEEASTGCDCDGK